MREATLAQVMPYLGNHHMALTMKDYANEFFPKTRAFKILRNTIEYVVQERHFSWKKVFGQMPTTVEEKRKLKELSWTIHKIYDRR